MKKQLVKAKFRITGACEWQKNWKELFRTEYVYVHTL